MASVDFASNNPSYLAAFGDTVQYEPVSSPAFTCLAIESRPRNIEDVDPRRPSYWFNLPADLSTAVDGRDLQVKPEVADLVVIGSKNYVVVNTHGDGAGGVYLTLEIE
jgi:hypothetical protein